MSQKTNPCSLRLQKTNKRFECSWYSDHFYTQMSTNDLEIRSYIERVFRSSTVRHIEHSYEHLCLQNHYKRCLLFLFAVDARETLHDTLFGSHMAETQYTRLLPLDIKSILQSSLKSTFSQFRFKKHLPIEKEARSIKSTNISLQNKKEKFQQLQTAFLHRSTKLLYGGAQPQSSVRNALSVWESNTTDPGVPSDCTKFSRSIELTLHQCRTVLHTRRACRGRKEARYRSFLSMKSLLSQIPSNSLNRLSFLPLSEGSTSLWYSQLTFGYIGLTDKRIQLLDSFKSLPRYHSIGCFISNLHPSPLVDSIERVYSIPWVKKSEVFAYYNGVTHSSRRHKELTQFILFDYLHIQCNRAQARLLRLSRLYKFANNSDERLIAPLYGVSRFVTISSVQVLHNFSSVSFLINEIIHFLKKGLNFRQITEFIIREAARRDFIKGVRLSCSGRLGGGSKKAQKSRAQSFQWGESSLHAFSSKLSFASSSVSTRFGKVGIKLWLSYK